MVMLVNTHPFGRPGTSATTRAAGHRAQAEKEPDRARRRPERRRRETRFAPYLLFPVAANHRVEEREH